MLGLKDIEEAKVRVGESVRVTPLVPAPDLSSASVRVSLKLENMQRTGSFKERGALNKLRILKERKTHKGIVAASAGNHAQAVSLHGTQLGFDVKIVMPEPTALNKVLATRRWGAQVILKGNGFDEATQYAREIAAQEQRALIHAFDDTEVIAGQGTLGLELLDQLGNVDVVVIPVGGGGLAGGTAIALTEKRKSCRVIGVQVETYPHAYRVYKGEKDSEIKKDAPPTLADGISMKGVGKETTPILKRYLDDMVIVSEDEISAAILNLLESNKVLAEGAGAAAFAAVASGKISGLSGEVVAVVSGGNIDVTLISRIIEKGMVKSGRLLRLQVVIDDRPGGLRMLAGLMADLKANILQVHHERASSHIPLYTTGTDLTIETRGDEHIAEIVRTLREQGYSFQVRD